MGSVGASARVVFPFAVAKVLLFAKLTKYFKGKIQTNFHRFSHTAGTQPLTQKTFSHTKTAPKKQCASRTPAHTLYNIRNEFLIKISDSIKLHFFSAKKIRKATFVAYFNFDSFLIHSRIGTLNSLPIWSHSSNHLPYKSAFALHPIPNREGLNSSISANVSSVGYCNNCLTTLE